MKSGLIVGTNKLNIEISRKKSIYDDASNQSSAQTFLHCHLRFEQFLRTVRRFEQFSKTRYEESTG